MTNEEAANHEQSPHQSTEMQGDVRSKEHQVLFEASASWEGPLPPPAMLHGYDIVVPGAANRILEIAERQGEHRIQMEKVIIRGDSKRAYLGIAAAFALSVMVIGGGIYLIATGHDWAGVSLIGLNLVGLTGVFIYGSKNLRDDRQPAVEVMDTDS